MSFFRKLRGDQKKEKGEKIKAPVKFSGAISLTPTLIRGKKESRVWVGVPVVDVGCPQCGQAVDAQGNQLALRGEPDYEAGTLPGGIMCSRCRTIFNEAICYFDDNLQLAPALHLALCVLTDEDPRTVLAQGFLPGKTLQEGIFVAEGAQVGRNVQFIPPVLINGETAIADQCEIGPFVYLEDAKIEKKGVRLAYCDIRESTVNQDSVHCTFHHSYIG